jgi:hypothetical protein
MILPPTWSLPDALRARLGQSTFGRQRALFEEGHLLLVLHRPPGPDNTKREGVLFWRTPAGDWQFSRGGPGPGGLKRHLQDYAELEAKLTAQYDQAADSTALFNLIEILTPLVRSARNQHAALQSAREAIKGDALLIELRDRAYELERGFELLLEDARNALSYRTTRDGEERAQLSREALRASHRLNVVAALFLPLTAITSVFGMNLPHGIQASSSLLFWLVFLGGLGLGIVIRAWVVARPAPSPPANHAKSGSTPAKS